MNEAAVLLVTAGGPPVVVVAGGTVSTVHSYSVGSPTFPAGSVARTPNLCRPSARPEYALGLVQGANTSVSSLHSNVLPTLFEVKTKFALVLFVGSGGSDA